MKIDQTNIADLVKVGDNKRKQLPPKQRTQKTELVEQEKKVNKAVTKPAKIIQQAKRGRPRQSDENITYRYTKLLLPEDLKDDLDYLFIDYKDIRAIGKNQFMVEAIAERVKKERKKRETKS